MSMPEPPDVGFFTRWALENPWPAGGVLLAIGGILVWTALREGLKDRLRIGGAFVVVAVAILMLDVLVKTSGEKAAAQTRALVEKAVAADVQGVMDHFAAGAVMSLASPSNRGEGIDSIRRQAENLQGRWRIESNRITMLHAHTISRDTARVDLSCVTDLGFGPTPSQWVLEFRREPGGEMLIDHITCISILGRSATPEDLR